MKKHTWMTHGQGAICQKCMTLRIPRPSEGTEVWQRPSDFKPKIVKVGKTPWGCRG